LFNNDVSVGAAVVDPAGKWQIDAPINTYLNDVEAFGFAPDGQEIGSTGVQQLTLAAAAAPLMIESTEWDEFSLGSDGLPQAALNLAGTGEPNTQVRLTLGDLDLAMVDVDEAGRWSFSGDVALAPGSYDLQASMTAPDAGEIGVAEMAGLVVPVIGSVPTFTVDAPSSDDMVLRGTAVPNTTVEIVANGEVVGTAVADADGNWSWTPDLSMGVYDIAVRDANNPAMMNEAQTIQIGLPVTIDSSEFAEAGDDLSELTLRGTAVPNSQVQIIINGEVVDTVTADADGNWIYTTTLPDGSYAVNGRYLDLSEEQTEQMAAAQTITIGEPTGTLQLFFAGTDSSSEGQPGTAPTGSPAVEIILDASGSMMEPLGDSTRFEAARTALQNITDNVLPDGTPIAVRAFGNIEGNYSCRTDLMIPYQPLDRAVMEEFLTAVNPQVDANTPIADSLARVQYDLADAGELERIVVLLTDGEETCGGDPAVQIQQLRDAGFGVQINIVGLAIADELLKEEFEYWAEIGGGQYFDAADSERLAEVLGEALLIPYVVRNEAGEVITIGRVGGQPQNLPAGTYEVEVRTSPAVTFDMVEISEGEMVQLTLDE
jgi:hypothetical protein